MPFLNKLVCFHGGFSETSPACQLCNITLGNCDDLYEPYELTNSHLLVEWLSSDPYSMKSIGYYPVKNNIFHKLEFCHSHGVNASTPVEPLHCVLLGLFIRLLQGFNWLQGEDMKIPESSTRETHFIFTGVYKEAVQTYWFYIAITMWSRHASYFFPSGYLPNVHNKDDNSTGGNGSWSEGSLASYFDFMLLEKHKNSLLWRVGAETLSNYIHLFKLSILFECWLGCDCFSREELEIAQNFIPILIQMVVDNVKQKGNGMKLPKIHQLHHFVEQIYDFGSASNISGWIGESNFKEKVERPSKTTWMELHDVKYWTAIKDTDWCLIHKAACEALEQGETILTMYIAEFKPTKQENVGHNILGIHWQIRQDDGKYSIQTNNTEYRLHPWKGVVLEEEIISYLSKLGNIEGFLHMDYKPIGGPWYHGNPIKGWQDWVKVRYGESNFMCPILIFLEVINITVGNSTALVPSKYALIQKTCFLSVITLRLNCTKKTHTSAVS